MSCYAISHASRTARVAWWITVSIATCLLIAVAVWQTVTSAGNAHSTAASVSGLSAVFDIGILVFREGLECVLVLAAITASMTGEQQAYRVPVAIGAGVGFGATLLTWTAAVRVLDDISLKVSALNLQAATGLAAIVVLLIVMNWFFHKMYWTGWISLHNRRKRALLGTPEEEIGKRRILIGLGLLGFSSLYREGVEVVLFLQSYRLKAGNEMVAYGVLLGLLLSAGVAVLTFLAHRKLPYRRMLVLTGVMLGLVLFVMVGEQGQEMQLAQWIPTTQIPWLVNKIPGWTSSWFSIFPTVETLAAQAIALLLVLGSYFLAQRPSRGK
jgi:high-affinity iron transporter